MTSEPLSRRSSNVACSCGAGHAIGAAAAADRRKVGALAFLIWQLGEETMRLALEFQRGEAALLVEAYKRMSVRAIAQP